MKQGIQSPLFGLRVLDLSRILAGPWASQLLGDLGADVVKVERPGMGDDTRRWGPPFVKDREGNDTSEAAYYLCANRNKRSLAVDISTGEGQALMRKMAASCDVLIENFRVGTMARYGLDYQSLKKLNPALVYCSITAFGQEGPEAAAPGYDAMIQGRGGLMSITGVADGEPGAGPQKVGVAMADLTTGMYAASAIQAALLARHRTGEGQHIDMALFDSQVAMLANQASNYLVGGSVPGRMGTAHPNIVPYQAFPTADGHLMLAVGNDRQFARLADAMGLPQLGGDPRYATNLARTENRAELVALLRDRFVQRTNRSWTEILTRAEVPFGPINSIDQVFDDPQSQYRGLKIELPHGQAGSVPSVANPIRFSDTPVSYRYGPPTLGEHSREVLQEWLGLEQSELDALASQGVI